MRAQFGTKGNPSKNDLPVKLNIKRKGFELSIEGTLSTMPSAINDFANLLTKVTTKFEVAEGAEEEQAEETTILATEEELSTTSSLDIPVIKPSKSTGENILSLYNTPWGRTPRTVAEVMKALQVNAAYDRQESVSTNLIRLVKRGQLRRIPREGKWAYVKMAGD